MICALFTSSSKEKEMQGKNADKKNKASTYKQVHHTHPCLQGKCRHLRAQCTLYRLI